MVGGLEQCFLFGERLRVYATTMDARTGDVPWQRSQRLQGSGRWISDGTITS